MASTGVFTRSGQLSSTLPHFLCVIQLGRLCLVPPIEQNCAGAEGDREASRQQECDEQWDKGTHTPVAARGGAPPHVTGGRDSPVPVKRGLGNWTGLGFRSQATTCCVIVGKFLAPQSLWPPPIKSG